MALAKGGQTIALWLIGSQTTAFWPVALPIGRQTTAFLACLWKEL